MVWKGTRFPVEAPVKMLISPDRVGTNTRFRVSKVIPTGQPPVFPELEVEEGSMQLDGLLGLEMEQA